MKKNRFCYAILAVGFAAAVAAPVIAGSLGGPLELADEGTFFVGGRSIFSEHPGDPGSRVGGAGAGHIMVDQMYVHYRIPKVVSAPPIVMVHGSTHTGATFETTPDGREGWATYFARKGYPVYVVDQVGRGRSGFDPTPINRAIVQSDVKSLSQIAIPTRERAWQSFHFGPEYPRAYPGTQFPVEATEQYLAQLVPNSEVTLAGQGIQETPKALVALLDKIGPSILMVHSQAGGYGLEVVRQSDKVRALVDIEGSCGPLSADDVSKRFVKQPMLSFWGDNTVGALGPNNDSRRNGCIATVDTIKAAGGNAKFFLLPDNGIKGNTHMMMFDKNNLQVADIIMKWLGEVGNRK